MNLIEQLGGYAQAKALRALPAATYDCGIKFNREELELSMLEYRRQHNIFEVGDWVFHTVCKNPLLERVTWVDGKRIRTDLAGSSAPTETFVHATTEEIKAGKRLEVS